MICLGIESSCDETALALVEDGRPLASVMATQAHMHAIFGGVVPELASREHYRFIGPLFDQLLERATISASQIGVVAVGRGPGLLGGLLVGVAFAKALALVLNIPLIGVNHLHAHLLAAGLEQEMPFPALGLLISGGHTHIYLIKSPSEFIQLGRTLDDAAGEAFDKIGHLLGLPYPAGKVINDLALAGKEDKKLLPRPYLDNGNLDFSFSGLKTAAAVIIKNNNLHATVCDRERKPELENFCASVNSAIADTLYAKFARACDQYPYVKTICVAGGVAANSIIREKMSGLAGERNLSFIAPAPALCTDNALMLAYAGWLLWQAGYGHNLDLEAIPRGRVIPDDMSRDLARQHGIFLSGHK